MKYKGIKEISRYRDADVCVNGEGPIDKEYYKGKLDNQKEKELKVQKL